MRLLCLAFPRLAIQLARRNHPELQRRPLVLVAGEGDLTLIAAASVEATAAGIRTGMLAMSARSRCPQALFAAYEPSASLDVLEDAVSILRRRATPAVVVGGPEHLILDLAGLDGLFPGEESAAVGLATFVRSWTRLDVRAGVGATAVSALAAASSALRHPVVVEDDGTPVERLAVEPDAILTARAAWPEPVPAQECRLRLVRLCGHLETVLRARGESFRSVSVEVVSPTGQLFRRVLASGTPMHTAGEALALIGTALGAWTPDAASRVEVSFGRLAPEFLVRPIERPAAKAPGGLRPRVQPDLLRAG